MTGNSLLGPIDAGLVTTKSLPQNHYFTCTLLPTSSSSCSPTLHHIWLRLWITSNGSNQLLKAQTTHRFHQSITKPQKKKPILRFNISSNDSSSLGCSLAITSNEFKYFSFRSILTSVIVLRIAVHRIHKSNKKQSRGSNLPYWTRLNTEITPRAILQSSNAAEGLPNTTLAEALGTSIEPLVTPACSCWKHNFTLSHKTLYSVKIWPVPNVFHTSCVSSRFSCSSFDQI